jgi:hypothetical protein
VPSTCYVGVAEWWVVVGPGGRGAGIAWMRYSGVFEGRLWGGCGCRRVDVGLWLWRWLLGWLSDCCWPCGCRVVMLVGDAVAVKGWEGAVVSCERWVECTKVVGPCEVGYL